MPEKSGKRILYILTGVLLAAFLIVPLISAKQDINSVYTQRNIVAPVFYVIMALASLVILLIYTLGKVRKHLWMILLQLSVCVVNLGYLAFSLSSNVSEALLANRISYIGNVYMILFLLLSISNACGVKFSKVFDSLLLIISSIMLVFSLTQGYLDLFYKNVEFTVIDGFVRLIKEYGYMHTVYVIYIFVYFLLIIGTVVYSVIRKKNPSVKNVIYIVILGFMNILIWFIEQFTENRIEYLSLSYVVNEILLLRIYGRLLKDGVIDSLTVKMTFHSEDDVEKTLDIVVNNNDSGKLLIHEWDRDALSDLAKLSDDSLRKIISKVESADKLTERETEVAVLILKNLRRKEMASSLCVSEETIKTHTSHIFDKFEVSSRKELQNKAAEFIGNNEIK